MLALVAVLTCRCPVVCLDGRTHTGRVMSGSELTGSDREFFVLVEALRAFKAKKLLGHPSDRALAAAAGVSPTTIGDWLRGRRFPQEVDKILIVVQMVRDAAAARGIANPNSGPVGMLDDNRWRTAHQAEAQRRVGIVSDEVKRAKALSVLAGSIAGWPLGEVNDPFMLEVWVPRTSFSSRDQAIFADQATGASLPSDVVLLKIDRFG